MEAEVVGRDSKPGRAGSDFRILATKSRTGAHSRNHLSDELGETVLGDQAIAVTLRPTRKYARDRIAVLL